MVIKSKYSTITNGVETLFTVTIPDSEYGEMLRKNPNPDHHRYEILNEAGRVEQKRAEIEMYLNQTLTQEQENEVKILAEAIAKHDKLIFACTDEACGYRDIQMRLIGGHRLCRGMERAIDNVRKTIDQPTENEINDCIENAMTELGYLSKSDFEYSKSRCGHKTWKIERIPVTGMDRDTVLKKLGKK